jgi:uncharacterized repeat protein (TIGR03806 family)
MARVVLSVAAAVALAACSGSAKTPPRPPGSGDAGAVDAGDQCNLADGSYLLGPCPSLSDYGLVSIQDAGIVYAAGVIPYDLNTPLFSDYATKERAVWLPPGTQATYDPVNAFTFPVGAVLIKSFGFPDDDRKASPIVTWVETRLLVNTPGGWQTNTYLWDAAQQHATILNSGLTVPVSWIWPDGGAMTAEYQVPIAPTQCEECHKYTDDNYNTTILPIGPKARQLNKNYTYSTGAANELGYWIDAGILGGAPEASEWPVLPVWDDPTTGTVAQRARAYLEGNCAHCHNGEPDGPSGGTASASGLWLYASETDLNHVGICKTPAAAGPATGGFDFDIDPGSPETSIVIYRMSSTTNQIMMPQIGRSVVDVDGVALVAEWIEEMDGGCP